MNKINTHYTHEQVQVLFDALDQAVTRESRAFEADCRYASDINNSDGVGIRFDYYSPAPLPTWVTAARQAMAPFRPS